MVRYRKRKALLLLLYPVHESLIPAKLFHRDMVCLIDMACEGEILRLQLVGWHRRMFKHADPSWQECALELRRLHYITAFNADHQGRSAVPQSSSWLSQFLNCGADAIGVAQMVGI
jgi:hypothetical protein